LRCLVGKHYASLFLGVVLRANFRCQLAYIGYPAPYRDSSEGQLCFLGAKVLFRDEFSGQLVRLEVSLHLQLYLGKAYVVWLVDLMPAFLPRFIKRTGFVVKLTDVAVPSVSQFNSGTDLRVQFPPTTFHV
jgi:hypothetical protein